MLEKVGALSQLFIFIIMFVMGLLGDSGLLFAVGFIGFLLECLDFAKIKHVAILLNMC